MNKNELNSAFLVPFFGKLPNYFDFWAKSCEANYQNFHWFVYNDTVREITHPNPAVTIIPYTFEELMIDFKNELSIEIAEKTIRRVCDYRLLFYFIRKEKENLAEFDFIGYTDVDMIYGDIMEYMPDDMYRYSLISGHDNRPCGPFTLMNRSQIHRLIEWDGIKEEMEKKEHQAFDESMKLKEILSAEMPALCQADPFQPQRAGLNRRHHFGVWENGKLTVYDKQFRKKPGAFYHFSRYKNKPRFQISSKALESSAWVVYKRGVAPYNGAATYAKCYCSLHI